MSDTEMLNLIEHYKWSFTYYPDETITVFGYDGIFSIADNANIRGAVIAALIAQRKWSVG